MYYAFVDTNIFIRVMSQGKPGCETEYFEKLQVLTTGGVLTMVIPEVVYLELEGQMHDLSDVIEQKFGVLKEAIGKTSVWSEIEDAKKSILQQLNSLRDEKIQHWQKLYKDVLALLNSSEVVTLPFTSEIMCRAQKRIIRRDMPKTSALASQDAAIVESLVVHFSSIKDLKPVLLFCSENHSDFAIELQRHGSQDRTFALHPVLAKDLPKTHFFTRLEDLLQIDQGYESLPQLPVDDEIQKASERLEILGSETDFDYDSDNEDYWHCLRNFETLCNSHLAHQYTAEVFSNLPEEFQIKHADLTKSIGYLLEQCRQCISWDDKSEEKLNQWIDNIPESMIPYTSLSNLVKIEKNLHRYLSIHKEMDDNKKSV